MQMMTVFIRSTATFQCLGKSEQNELDTYQYVHCNTKILTNWWRIRSVMDVVLISAVNIDFEWWLCGIMDRPFHCWKAVYTCCQMHLSDALLAALFRWPINLRLLHIRPSPQDAFLLKSLGLLEPFDNKSSSGDEVPERDVTSFSLFTCLPLNYDTPVRPEYFLSRPNYNCYISTGRRFMKSALRILLLSTFRVSSVNYSLASSHTRSSANAEGPRARCELKACKTLHKCSTDCIWKGLQPLNDLESHSRSLALLPFDRPYTISY